LWWSFPAFSGIRDGGYRERERVAHTSFASSTWVIDLRSLCSAYF
jgi:hypothetical protein